MVTCGIKNNTTSRLVVFFCMILMAISVSQGGNLKKKVEIKDSAANKLGHFGSRSPAYRTLNFWHTPEALIGSLRHSFFLDCLREALYNFNSPSYFPCFTPFYISHAMPFHIPPSWFPPPHKFFLSFSLEDKTSAPDVFSSCSFIPRADFETSLVMVSCYGYEIWRHK